MGTFKEPAVGLYWFVATSEQNVLLSHRCLLTIGEVYGDFITCPHSHHGIWESWQRDASLIPANLRNIVRDSEYEDWPRGRVVFHRRQQRFWVYADRKIFRNRLEPQVLGDFGIEIAAFKLDGHYRSSRRLASYS